MSGDIAMQSSNLGKFILRNVVVIIVIINVIFRVMSVCNFRRLLGASIAYAERVSE